MVQDSYLDKKYKSALEYKCTYLNIPELLRKLDNAVGEYCGVECKELNYKAAVICMYELDELMKHVSGLVQKWKINKVM